MTLSLGDFLTLVGLMVAIGGPAFWYMKRRVDTVTENHLTHIDRKIDDVGEKVDTLSSDVKLMTGRIEGWDLDNRVTRLERRQFVGWDNK